MILRCTILKRPYSSFVIVLLIATSSLSANETPLASADDSTSAPGLDLGALANLAQNPQVINIVSSLLNQNGQKPLAGQNLDGSPSDLPPDSQNSISQDNFPISGGPSMGEPLRRNSKPSSPSPTPAAQPSSPGLATTDGAKNGGIGSLMSMLPGLLPNLGTLGNLGNLGNLGSLGNLGNLGSMLSAVAGSKQAGGNSTSGNNKTVNSPPVPDLSLPPQPAAAAASPAATISSSSPPSATATAAPNGGGGASSAISQVIAAYANGQIPSELIQMTMAGKIPTQVIDLALNGQLPPQLVQMAVTGQIPVSTMRAIFESAGGAPSQQQVNASGGAAQQAAGGAGGRAEPAVHGGGPSGSGANQRGMARALLETLFRYQKDAEGKRSIQVPTILGSVPVQLPNLPRVRHIGQIVGGTITSVANLIPF